ncbi:hypothetical protein Vretimale_7076 [Volvox reticuliferus]|uniref:Protein kinase domain-containing protein n=1 Tax=Volvox reticuliferus TaxID=1737510 RepID=A0A8J4FS30_9CHLO|nr:hypothetical protein Vretifemale_10957 [Volvox reticuliferus]GIM02161.1 hypothetical protein Vretimale_7076 [Volvox reticuliferus]
MIRIYFIMIASLVVMFPSRMCFTVTASPDVANESKFIAWCQTGEELVAAIANPVVNHAFLVTDVFVTESHFKPYTKPMVVQRNFTIMGHDPVPAAWPVLDLGFVAAWIQVDPGCVFGLAHLALRSYRQGPHFQGPGYDIFVGPTFLRPAQQPPPSVAPAAALNLSGPLILQWNSSLIQRSCLPNSMYIGSVENLPRPDQVPGKQAAQRLPIPANCSSNPGAPTMTRCWPAWGVYADVASESYQEVLLGHWMPAGIELHLRNVYYMCDKVMDADCAKRLGNVGCFYSMFPRGNSSGNKSTSNVIGSSSSSNGTGSSGNANGSSGSTKTDADAKVVILASILGSFAFLLLLAVAVAVAAVRYHHRSGAAGKSLCGARGFVPGVWDTCNCTAAVVGCLHCSTPDYFLRSRSGMYSETVTVGPQQAQPAAAAVAVAVDADAAAAPEDVLVPLQQRTSPQCRQHQSHFRAVAQQSASQTQGEMALVTSLTPLRPNVDYDVQMGGGELEVDPVVVLGKGSYGRVIQGIYRGERVAVKFINTGLLEGCFRHSGVKGGDVGVRGRTDATEELGPGPKAVTDREQTPTGTSSALAAEGVSMNEDKLEKGACNDSSEVYLSAAAATEGCGAQPPQQLDNPPRPLPARQNSDLLVRAQRALVQEVEVLARCEHPNIVKLLAANLRPPRICLVMELMDISLEKLMYGDLKRVGRALPLPTVLHIGIQIARALSYLHPTILHRDLKPANVLISEPDSPAPVVKLADFGLSRLLQTALVTANPAAGTTPYMAPEVFDITNTTVTDRADIYGFGVMMWEMLAAQRPWHGFTHLQIAVSVAVLRMRLPLQNITGTTCPVKLRSLIWSCWEPDPARRPAAAEVVKTLALVQEKLTLENQQLEVEAAAVTHAPFTSSLSQQPFHHSEDDHVLYCCESRYCFLRSSSRVQNPVK